MIVGLAMASGSSLSSKKVAKTAANKAKKASVAAKKAVDEQAVAEKARLSAIAEEDINADINLEDPGETDISVDYDPTADGNADWDNEEVVVIPVTKKAKATKATRKESGQSPHVICLSCHPFSPPIIHSHLPSSVGTSGHPFAPPMVCWHFPSSICTSWPSCPLKITSLYMFQMGSMLDISVLQYQGPMIGWLCWN